MTILTISNNSFQQFLEVAYFLVSSIFSLASFTFNAYTFGGVPIGMWFIGIPLFFLVIRRLFNKNSDPSDLSPVTNSRSMRSPSSSLRSYPKSKRSSSSPRSSHGLSDWRDK